MPDTTQPNPNDFFDTSSPDVEGVKEFLAAAKPEAAPARQQNDKLPELRQVSPDEGFSATWGQADSGIDEVQQQKDPTLGMEVPVPESPPVDIMFDVRDDSIPISEEEKKLYLKATLNDAPVVLEVRMRNGMSFKVRSISTYEGDLAMKAALDYIKDDPSMGLAHGLGQNIAQQYRLAMQIVEVNNVPIDYLHFEFKYGQSSKERDSKELRRRSDEMLMNTQGIRYGLMLRALNVFQCKMDRLQAAAFTLDFWSPDSID